MLQLLRRYRELLVVAALLVAPALLYLSGSRAASERNALDRGVLTVFSPVQKAVFWVVHKAQDAWYGYVWLVGVHEDNFELRRENLRLRGDIGETDELRIENERLRRLLGFQSRDDRRSVAAPIVAIGANPALSRTLRIGRGRADGIAPGQAVVTPEGVVGQIVAAGPGWADVMLIADPNSAVAGQVQRSRARASVRGTGALEAGRLEHALRTDDFSEGDLLVTSGTGGVFPKGLTLGRIAGIERKSYGMFQTAEVRPVVDLSRVEEVLVLVPADAEGPADAVGEGVPPAAAPGPPGTDT